MFHRHKWSNWADVPSVSILFLYQRKRCERCGKVKERYAG